MRSPRVLAGGMVLFSAVLALIAGRTAVEGCAPAPHAGQWVDIRDESALIVWDPATKTEQFVRRARFDTTSDDFGFLVPTPTQPELGEADDKVFHRLGRLTAPRYVYEQRVKTVFGFGDLNRFPTAMAPNAMPDSVEVLEQKQVAGLDATVVRADDAQALAEWLDEHGYEQRPALTEWLQWYVDHKWIITAFKMSKGDRREFQSKALRMTFQAEQPFYPYREPADMRKPSAQGARTLRVYFLSDQKYSGTLGADGHWPSTTVWANGIGGSNHDITMQLKLDGDKSLPETINYLTEFEDHSFPRPGTDEVYFVPASDQTTKERPPIIQTTTLIRIWPGPPGLLVLGAAWSCPWYSVYAGSLDECEIPRARMRPDLKQGVIETPTRSVSEGVTSCETLIDGELPRSRCGLVSFGPLAEDPCTLLADPIEWLDIDLSIFRKMLENWISNVEMGRMNANYRFRATAVAVCLGLLASHLIAAEPGPGANVPFREGVGQIFERHCVRCHNDEDHKGGLSLTTHKSLLKGGDNGAAITAGKPADSLLLQYVVGDKPEMPKNAPPLSKVQLKTLQDWVESGAVWPESVTLKDRQFEGQVWWSAQPLRRPAVPVINPLAGPALQNPIDAFIRSKLTDKRLSPSPEADRTTLIRRLSFDLHGLPPDPADIDEFVADTHPCAYERLVDRLLASPRYGERWARHWLDVVHYGDTHGYDKDKLRPNAWPYRDYVIRSLNEDKPYDRFVLEQIAGDILWPDTVDGITGTGFIAAGPWDFIGHAEVPESKIDGKIARNLDRDDMVTTTMNTFCSLTVQCARCHNHKFDPVTQTDYYRLQAVFAALDRADRMFDANPAIGQQRQKLLAEQQRLKGEEQRLAAEMARLCGPELKELDQKIAAAQQAVAGQRRPEYGYHSAIEATADKPKWVQVDLGREVPIRKLSYVGCWDDFNNIGAGFGFPVRFKIEAANDAELAKNVVVLVDQTAANLPNPGTTLQQADVQNVTARYVRFTATRLAPRQNDFIFALAELSIFDAEGKNVALGATVTALDSIEAPIRWAKKNLVDGIFTGQSGGDINALREQRSTLLTKKVTQAVRDDVLRTETALAEVARQIGSLPAAQYVYAGMVYNGGGTFAGTGPTGGKPRPIRVLKRGDVTTPGDEVGPGIVPLLPGEASEFTLPADHSEGARRVALAKWIVDDNHPLTWRSIANRIWLHHLGRGIVDSPNDFGRMGQLPTHPELLDWLASEIRGDSHRGSGQFRTLKQLHRLITTSAAYRQTSEITAVETAESPQAVDSTNSLYWRANRRKLDAESLRDSMLLVAGKLDDRMGGPAFQDFVIEKPEHSPHYQYHLHDAEDPRSHRRSIYRFLVRSQTQPFMTTLDCADPSMIVEKRNETVTALQALALLNNKLVLSMSRHMAARVEASSSDGGMRIDAAFRLALGRRASPDERAALVQYSLDHGFSQACRVILNLNEFAFVD